jgi:hypothetical protein
MLQRLPFWQCVLDLLVCLLARRIEPAFRTWVLGKSRDAALHGFLQVTWSSYVQKRRASMGPLGKTSADVVCGTVGAYDEAHLQTQVSEIKSGIGVLARGTILATGSGGDIGKLVELTAGTEGLAFGVLLDPAIDTAAPYSDGSVTASIAQAGSFRGPALIVPAGVDAGLIAVALRGRGIFVEGPISVPAAAATSEA